MIFIVANANTLHIYAMDAVQMNTKLFRETYFAFQIQWKYNMNIILLQTNLFCNVHTIQIQGKYERRRCTHIKTIQEELKYKTKYMQIH